MINLVEYMTINLTPFPTDVVTDLLRKFKKLIYFRHDVWH